MRDACKGCGIIVDDGFAKNICVKCYEKCGKGKKSSAILRKKLGLCSRCGQNIARAGRTTCECVIIYYRKYKDERNKQGLCTECPNIAIAGKRLCEECNKFYSDRYSHKRKAADDIKTCTRCFKNPPKNDDAKWCILCCDKEKTYSKNIKNEVITFYGGKCKCCNESNIMFLTMDHINNDGASHRRSINGSENGKGNHVQIYKWIKKNNFPGIFQVLCFNCNCGKAINGGICPHRVT